MAATEAQKAASRAYYAKNRERVLQQRKDRRAADPEGVRAVGRQWFANNPDKKKAFARKSNLKRYGLTPDQYDDMLTAQGGRCAICLTDKADNAGKSWLVDHCHDTGAVRGLLCRKCNTGLGQFNDNVVVLAGAIKYLEKANAAK